MVDTAGGDVVDVEIVRVVEELAPGSKTLHLWAFWAAIIRWIHFCWAGLNNKASLGSGNEVAVMGFLDEDEASADKFMLIPDQASSNIKLF